MRRFQQVGFMLGFDDGMKNLHYLLESAFCSGAAGDELSLPFLRALEHSQSFETNPIFAVLHEACYTQRSAARWSAERVRGEFPDMNWAPGREPSFTGEMNYPWMFDDYRALQPTKEAAQILAEFDGWPRLYHQEVLQQNRVPVAAAMYYNDMYVDRLLSEETASFINGIHVWATSEYEHNCLRADGENILGRLFGLVRGGI